MPLSVLFFLIVLLAPIPTTASGPATIQLKASLGTVSFPHEKHQAVVPSCETCHHKGVEKGACHHCHEATSGAPQGKDAFHKVCRGCHEKTAGPTQCSGCHHKQ